MNASATWARWRDEELLIDVHVQPGARRTSIAGTFGSRLKIALQAPPVDGKANEALLRFLAGELQVRRSGVRLVSGASARDKTVAIAADRARAGEWISGLGESPGP
jgi:uncharacterized protein (TIGR00251 family)